MRKEKRIIFLKFVLLYIISILSVFTIGYTCNSWRGKNEKENNKELITSTELMNRYITRLAELNSKSLINLKSPVTTSEQRVISNERKLLINSAHDKIDSIGKAGRKYSGISQTTLNHLLLQFQEAIESLETANNFVLSIRNSDTLAVTDLTIQLKLEKARIAILEDKLNAAQKKVKVPRVGSQKDGEEIKFLRWALRTQVATNRSLEEKLKTIK